MVLPTSFASRSLLVEHVIAELRLRREEVHKVGIALRRSDAARALSLRRHIARGHSELSMARTNSEPGLLVRFLAGLRNWLRLSGQKLAHRFSGRVALEVRAPVLSLNSESRDEPTRLCSRTTA